PRGAQRSRPASFSGAQRAGDDPRPAYLPAPGAGIARSLAGNRRHAAAPAFNINPYGGGEVKIAFYGSSLLSSYWNGAATYYRGLLHALSRLGYEITFYEPNVYERQAHRDIDPPDWCRVVVYEGTDEALADVAARAAEADV